MDEVVWIGQAEGASGCAAPAALCLRIVRAAEAARFFDLPAVTVYEFGVASGEGLINMLALSKLVTAETGVKFRVVGFDTGHGLPKVEGHRDHAELWAPGDFPMKARDRLMARLKGQAELVFGDIDATVPFVKTLDVQGAAGVHSN